MKIHNVPQGTPEWFMLRAGIPTASEFHRLLTPKFKAREGETPEKYLAEKLAERWQGGPLPSFTGYGEMEQGKILEEEARPWCEVEYGTTIETVGFVTDDAGRIGCSPDGLIGDDGGIEIKCPQADTHCRYLLNNQVPEQYLTQVHGSLLVTGRAWWRFVSYRRGFPALMIQVNRDEKILATMAEYLAAFNDKLDRDFARMVEINGGPPVIKKGEKPFWWGAGLGGKEEAA